MSDETILFSLWNPQGFEDREGRGWTGLYILTINDGIPDLTSDIEVVPGGQWANFTGRLPPKYVGSRRLDWRSVEPIARDEDVPSFNVMVTDVIDQIGLGLPPGVPKGIAKEITDWVAYRFPDLDTQRAP